MSRLSAWGGRATGEATDLGLRLALSATVLRAVPGGLYSRQPELIVPSLPHPTGSRVRIDLALDPPVATGSWTEATAPDGYYRVRPTTGLCSL
jgi:hypothetical protein